jgi:16S rRNA processing protein RimM
VEEARPIIVGEIAGAYGVKGWVKIHSFTKPPRNILDYAPWLLVSDSGQQEYKVLAGKPQGQTIIAQLENIEDRDQALMLRSYKIMVPKDRFPPAEPGHYYWADLVGLKVRNLDAVDFGTVVDMLETGANDVVVAQGERERLIPFVIGPYIKDINLTEGTMLVDWDAEF